MNALSNERIAYFNGTYVPESEVRVPFRDRSWLRLLKNSVEKIVAA